MEKRKFKLQQKTYKLCSDSGRSLDPDDTLYVVVNKVPTNTPVKDLFVDIVQNPDSIVGYSVLQEAKVDESDNRLKVGDKMINFISKMTGEHIFVRKITNPAIIGSDKVITSDEIARFNNLLGLQTYDDTKNEEPAPEPEPEQESTPEPEAKKEETKPEPEPEPEKEEHPYERDKKRLVNEQGYKEYKKGEYRFLHKEGAPGFLIKFEKDGSFKSFRCEPVSDGAYLYEDKRVTFTGSSFEVSIVDVKPGESDFIPTDEDPPKKVKEEKQPEPAPDAEPVDLGASE